MSVFILVISAFILLMSVFILVISAFILLMSVFILVKLLSKIALV